MIKRTKNNNKPILTRQYVYKGSGSPGRPTKFRPEIVEKLLGAIAEGNYYDTACAYAGINYTTMQTWIKKGIEEGPESPYYHFLMQIKKAEQEAEMGMVKQWKKHMPEDWKAIATFMERRWKQKWGRNSNIVIDQNVQGEVKHVNEYRCHVIQELISDPEFANRIADNFRQRLGTSSSEG